MGKIKLEIDERKLEAEEGQTVLEVAKENDIEIPTHCYLEPYESAGLCRLCLVEIRTPEKRPELKAACTYPVRENLKVRTDTKRVQRARRLSAELLLARCPESKAVEEIAKEIGVEEIRFSEKDLNCTLCGLCVRACKEATGDNVITFVGRGPDREIMAPFELLPEECEECGACANVCPTNAIQMVEIEKEE